MPKPASFTNAPLPEQYAQAMGRTRMLDGRVVVVLSHTRHSRQGSYERGLKFGTTSYGYLMRQETPTEARARLRKIHGGRIPKWLERVGVHRNRQFSFDHGKTWHRDLQAAWKATRRGRIKVSSEVHPEMAFDAIRQIADRYGDGPWYR